MGLGEMGLGEMGLGEMGQNRSFKVTHLIGITEKPTRDCDYVVLHNNVSRKF